MKYKGIEYVDPELRSHQRILTEALWEQLKQQGVSTKSIGQIKGVFFSEDVAYARAVSSSFPSWENEHKESEDGKYITYITSSQCQFSLQALTELTDIFLIAASETNTSFDGLEVELHNAQNLRSKWWKFWE